VADKALLAEAKAKLRSVAMQQVLACLALNSPIKKGYGTFTAWNNPADMAFVEAGYQSCLAALFAIAASPDVEDVNVTFSNDNQYDN
jgi:hypothetical protein